MISAGLFRRKRLILATAIAALLATQAQAAVPIAEDRYPIQVGSRTVRFPYTSSHDLSVRNEKIEHIIFAIHCSGFNAYMCFDNTRSAMISAGVDREKYLVIAPHFLSRYILQERFSRMPSGTLYWRGNPFWGSADAVYNSRNTTISSYAVVDQMLTDVLTQGNFPNVKDVVIHGFSAGGQMVNRYAATNMFEQEVAAPAGVQVRYLVMAPSTYVYFTPERVGANGADFEIPYRRPADYNIWGYGLDGLYTYHQQNRFSARNIRDQYADKSVLYLVGSKDVDPTDPSLAKNPPAMLQGKDRLERGYIYMNYLAHLFGPDIHQRQQFHEIPNIGHRSLGLMVSPVGREFMFPQAAAQLAQQDAR